MEVVDQLWAVDIVAMAEQDERGGLVDRKNFKAKIKAYRERAAKMRADGEKTNDRVLKRRMFELAESLDFLAEATEELRKPLHKPAERETHAADCRDRQRGTTPRDEMIPEGDAANSQRQH